MIPVRTEDKYLTVMTPHSNKPFPAWIVGEVLGRIIVMAVFLYTEEMSPFQRVIQPEELWLYRFPHMDSYVSSHNLWVMVLGTTFFVIFCVFLKNRNTRLAIVALGVPSLALPMNGIITNLIKVTVGRPRPDYLNRCYGKDYIDVLNLDKPCVGDILVIEDGRKSFPSGHSSMSFCGFGFAFLYLAAQLHTFQGSKKLRSISFVFSIAPLVTATLVAISRTCDYHHHWQDVTVGSILGFLIVLAVYRLYFPSLWSDNCHKPSLLVRSQIILSSPTKKILNGPVLDGIKCI